MASLAAATLSRADVGDLVVLNRTEEKAARLAQQYGGRTAPLEALPDELRRADVVVSCTGAVGLVLTAEAVRASRAGVDAPLAAIDLAMPHDLDPAIADVPRVALIGLRRLAEELTPAESEGVGDVLGVRRIVAEEIQAFLSARRLANVTPTVVALRTMATGVVDAELARLDARLPDLEPEVRAELELAVRRVADKLMHHPTVRVKELANSTGAVSYAAALAELFALDQQAVEAVTRAEGVRP
jgi:glutamyl-tRNA reductase